ASPSPVRLRTVTVPKIQRPGVPKPPAADPVTAPTVSGAVGLDELPTMSPATAPKPVTVAAPKPVMPGPKPLTVSAPKPLTVSAPKPAAAPAAGAKPVTVAVPKPVQPSVVSPKESSPAQIQAAKSKTSRISLDSAIGVGTGISSEPKTIKLKRPSDLSPSAKAPTPAPLSQTAPIHQTSRIPDSVLPQSTPDPATVTQKKTLKIKRPGAASAPASAPVASASAATSEEKAKPANNGIGLDDADFANLTPLPLENVPKASSGVGTTIAAIAAIIAVITLGLLALCLGSQAMGPVAGPNALATVNGPELPWTGK
ncbi:MAG: hypothetical protein J6Z49_10525, partial [Kiritimatiellae bacterium]|nr:hypothetical protein [Kiritimatiellia bacterium]